MVETYRFLDKAYDDVWKRTMKESYLLFKYGEKLPNGLIAAPGLFADRNNTSVDLIVADEVGGTATLQSYPDGLYCQPSFDRPKWLKYKNIMSFHILVEHPITDPPEWLEGSPDEKQLVDGDIVGVFVAFGAEDAR